MMNNVFPNFSRNLKKKLFSVKLLNIETLLRRTET